ncbi:ATP-binding protein [Hymenobacter sp. H14-R3]|uniref:sensor histidine kinase n=1 Tax=Hymenobacter sp. H14-R3 TaxID=3046308 RepID=UPI0024BBA52F|nr:ATP-binding protein [Hymenobacter sp. H14-R3]MDJ0367736.1 ATP-binding protein [Hymenobacter sp. H14-R3]
MKQAVLDWKHLYNWNLLAATGLALVLAFLLRSLLDRPRYMPRARTWLLLLWVPAVVGFGVTAALHYQNSLLDDWYILFVFGVAAAVLWPVRHYRPAAIMLWALVIPALYRAVVIGQAVLDYQFVAPLAGYFKSLARLNVFWFGIITGLAFYQKKTLAKENAQRAEEEQQRRQAAARNAALERLVATRTAALTQQASELQTALAELRATQQQLIQREKMASLGELTAGIAHEIQNPLNFVNNFADVSAELVDELVAEQTNPTPDAGLEDELLSDLRHNLHKINQHGQRAASIVRGMLAHSRQSTGERQPTDLNALADEYLRLAYHGLRAKDKSFNATLDTDFAALLPLVPAVSGDVGRVLLNLFTNAFYAVQQRQQAAGPGYAPTVQVRTRRVGEEVEICIRDNGMGIPEAVRSKIFQPFFTTKPSGEGTGLGLSLAHDIVVQGHGGTLAVTSQEGEFTEFIVRLPFRGAVG